jgi:ribosomal-protein-serine acetyltransferase
MWPCYRQVLWRSLAVRVLLVAGDAGGGSRERLFRWSISCLAVGFCAALGPDSHVAVDDPHGCGPGINGPSSPLSLSTSMKHDHASSWLASGMSYGRAVMRRLPEQMVGPGSLTLRRWIQEDAEKLDRAVTESVEHLRPWMPWVAQEPLPINERRALINGWEQERLAGGDVVMGIFIDGAVAGGCGLHRRIGPGGVEIGYWTARSFLRRGTAAAAARLLTDAAFACSEIMRVEIHHDQANQASAGVPRKLGFELVREVHDEVQAPGETGVSCEWQMTRGDWRRLGAQPAAVP